MEPAASSPSAFPTHGAGPAGRSPSPVCRRPFYFLQSREAPAVRAPRAKEAASPRQEGMAVAGEGPLLRAGGGGTPLFLDGTN